jgi:hypothetical protein
MKDIRVTVKAYFNRLQQSTVYEPPRQHIVVEKHPFSDHDRHHLLTNIQRHPFNYNLTFQAYPFLNEYGLSCFRNLADCSWRIRVVAFRQGQIVRKQLRRHNADHRRKPFRNIDGNGERNLR